MGDRIFGAKGGSQQQSSRTPVESPDSLQSIATARVLMLMGLGQFAGPDGDLLQSIYLDGVPLKSADGTLNFERVTAEWRAGTQNQDRIEGFSEIETEYGVGVEVKATAPATRQIDDLDADAVRVTVSVPALVEANASNGDTNPTSVQMGIDLKPAIGSWQQIKTVHINGKTRSKYQRSVRIPLTGAGPWQLRVRRITADSGTQNLQNATAWDSYTVINDAPLRYPNYALLALRFDAKAFSSFPKIEVRWKLAILQVPSNYDPATRSYSGPWDGTFKPAWSDNPAWWLWTYATDPRYNVNIPPGAWKWDLYRIAQWCDQLVNDGQGGTRPRFTCNFIQSESVDAWKVLQDIASVFCGRVIPFAGGVRVTADIPGDVPAKHFMPANVKDGRFNYSSTELADRHTVAVVSFIDPDDGDKRATEYVEHAEGLTVYGYQPVEVAAVGCTARAQAQQLGRYILETAQSETEMVSFGTGTYGMDLAVGELFHVSHPPVAGGRFGGRLLSVDGVDVTLDAPVTLAAGVSYSLEVPMPDGTLVRRGVTNGVGSTAAIVLAAPFPSQPVEGTTWLLVATNVEPTLWRCVRNAEAKDNPSEREISGVQHDPNKWQRIEQGIRIDPPPVSLLPDPGRIDAVSVVAVREVSYLRPDGSRAVRLDVDWPALSHPYLRGYVVGIRQSGGDWRELPEQAANHAEVPDIAPGNWQVRVAAVSVTGLRSIQTVSDIAAEGHAAPPPAPGFTATGGAMRVDFTIAWPSPDCVRAELYGSGNAGDPNPYKLADIAYPSSTWSQIGLMSGVKLYYWLRVVDSWGNASAFAAASATTERDPSVLLDQLKNAVGLGELAADLAQPIASIDTIIPAALHDNALASLQLSLSDYDLTQRMQWQEEVTNATVGVDPVNGKIQLLATANVTTDVEQRLSQVEVVADAQKAALNSTVATLATVQGDLSSTQSQVSQLAGQVTTKASQVYVDDAVADATGQITVTAANAYSALADQAIREALDSFEAAGKQRDLQASVAAAQQDIKTHADAIAAETAARTALVASVAANAAAIVDEKKARVDADTAEATARQQLAARVTTVEGGVVSNAAAIEAESSARADGDAAEAEARQLLAARVDAAEDGVARNAADIASEAKARADDMGAAAGRMDSIVAVAGASSKSLAEHALREALDQFDSAGKQRDLQVSVATALSSVDAAAVALRAEVASRAQLVATVAGVQAAVVEERSARSSADEAEAKARQQLEARVSTAEQGVASNTAGLVDERTARVDGDSANARALEQVEARVSTAEQGVANNAAALLEERTARADGDSANATALQQVRARLDTGDYAAVKEQASATASKVGGIEAKYVLMVDANGHTAAMELGSADGRSHVVFLADDFLIAQPDGSGPPKQAFIVGTVNGITTVGIDGALLVDGSVVARHIAAKSLTVDQIDTRGLDIRDADGAVVFSAGTNLSASRITGLGGLASKDVVGAADVSVTSLSAIVAYLGEIVGGRVRNSSGSNYINFDAVGSQAFIQCGNGFTLRADGGGEFARPLISAPNVVSSGRQPVDAYVSHGQSQVFTIATEAYFPSAWNAAPSDMYAASCTISSGWSENGGGTGLGRVELLVGDGLSAGGGGYVDGRVYIRYHYEHTGQPIRITELQWKVVRL